MTRAELALEVFANRIHKYIGSMHHDMNGVDAIIFTAGIGENSESIRARVLKGLEFMGVYWDPSSEYCSWKRSIYQLSTFTC